ASSSSASFSGLSPMVRSDESPVPIPRATRPPVNSDSVAQVEANRDRCRVTAFVTPVPKTIFSVPTALAPMVTEDSRQMFCESPNQTLAYPRDSANWVYSLIVATGSVGKSPTPMLNMPPPCMLRTIYDMVHQHSPGRK